MCWKLLSLRSVGIAQTQDLQRLRKFVLSDTVYFIEMFLYNPCINSAEGQLPALLLGEREQERGGRRESDACKCAIFLYRVFSHRQ